MSVNGVDNIWRNQMVWMTPSGTTKNMGAVIMDLYKESDRASAIVACSLVEAALYEAIRRHLHKHEKIAKDLMSGSGALSAFGPKIDLGLLLGVYGQKAHSDLHRIRQIRNKFAHDLEINSFQEPKIAAWAMSLTMPERYVADVADTLDATGPRPRNSEPKDWPFWFAARKVKEQLAEPRGRYILAAQALCYGLTIPRRTPLHFPRF